MIRTRRLLGVAAVGLVLALAVATPGGPMTITAAILNRWSS